MSLVLRLPRERHLARSYICPTPAIVLGNPTKASRFAHFWQGPKSLAPATRKHIWTSKSGPNSSVFYTFDFWLGNVLRATTACTFSTSQLPKVVRTWCALYILTWKRASRHKAVQLFISHLTSWLRTGRSSKPTFRPSGATNHWKNIASRDFPTFSRTWIFFLLRLSFVWSSFFFSSLLRLFPSLLFICPYCRKFDV